MWSRRTSVRAALPNEGEKAMIRRGRPWDEAAGAEPGHWLEQHETRSKIARPMERAGDPIRGCAWRLGLTLRPSQRRFPTDHGALRRSLKPASFSILAMTLLVLGGCSPPEKQDSRSDAFGHSKAAHASQSSRPMGIGKVLEIDPNRGTITIVHGVIQPLGLPAATTTFKIKSSIIRGTTVGDDVSFELDPASPSRVTGLGPPQLGR